ncbi:MAG: hypothetical protein ACK41V_10880 [Acidovorax sp.]|uniref:hypothetical protein n=1 Tax=Acidovorax sp. TaxID=1872122 RepID=UPI00391AB364
MDHVAAFRPWRPGAGRVFVVWRHQVHAYASAKQWECGLPHVTDSATLIGGDRAAIARVDGEPLLWQLGEQSYKAPFSLFYLVVLASFGKDEETRTFQRYRVPRPGRPARRP